MAQDLEKMGRPFRFVDSSRLASEGRLQFRAGQHSGSTWTCVDGQPIALEAVDTVWHRRRYLPRLRRDIRSAINSISSANGRR